MMILTQHILRIQNMSGSTGFAFWAVLLLAHSICRRQTLIILISGGGKGDIRTGTVGFSKSYIWLMAHLNLTVLWHVLSLYMISKCFWCALQLATFFTWEVQISVNTSPSWKVMEKWTEELPEALGYVWRMGLFHGRPAQTLDSEMWDYATASVEASCAYFTVLSKAGFCVLDLENTVKAEVYLLAFIVQNQSRESKKCRSSSV